VLRDKTISQSDLEKLLIKQNLAKMKVGCKCESSLLVCTLIYEYQIYMKVVRFLYLLWFLKIRSHLTLKI